MTLGELTGKLGAELKRHGVPGAEADLEWIIGAVTHYNRVQLLINREFSLTPAQEAQINQMVQRRINREPLQYILGNQCFMNLKLKCDGRALIPRSETELLAEQCINLVRKGYPRFSPFLLLDIGTGTGALALGIAKAASNVRAVGCDISEGALALAAENAQLCNLSDRVQFVRSNLYSAFEGRQFNGIVSNPPYIPSAVVDELMPEVAKYEPHLALDGGQNGTDFYAKIIPEAPEHLLPGGFLAMEAEHFQFDYIEQLIIKTGAFGPVKRVADYNGQYRLCYCIKKA